MLSNLNPAPANPQGHNFIMLAVRITDEFDSEQTYRSFVPGNACAKCNVWEECEGDNDSYGRPIAVSSDKLASCATCTDCLVHPACADKGMCPHCAWIEKGESSVPCSGCVEPILFVKDGESGYDLPADAKVCTCGFAYHAGCECWAHSNGPRTAPDPVCFHPDAVRLTAKLNACVANMAGADSALDLENITFEAQRVAEQIAAQGRYAQ